MTHLLILVMATITMGNTPIGYQVLTPEEAIRVEERRLGIPSGLLVAICTVESNLRPLAANKRDGHALAGTSHGLCQIKLRTARGLGYTGDAKGLYDPRTNAHYAGLYLRSQHNRYGSWVLATSAYNMGRVKRLSTTKGSILANSSYIEKVMSIYMAQRTDK